MNIALIIANYNSSEFIQRAIYPWIEYNKNATHKIIIGVIDGLFIGFDGKSPNSDDGGVELMDDYVKNGHIHSFIKSTTPLTEHDARNIALKNLTENYTIDYVMISAFDEIFTVDQIENIVSYIIKNPFIYNFRLQYKNYTFSNKTYTLGFNPKRIWKLKPNITCIFDKFRWDDDGQYKNENTGAILLDDYCTSKTIPNILIRHETWLSNTRSKNKVEYQEKHFAPPTGAGCSFRWNDAQNILEFNDNYYKITNTQKPTLYHDD